MKKPKSIALAIIVALTVNLAACGTILYPERKGQIKGRIDPSVAVLDGVGLLFFLVPGVIAFAVDFNNGTIYLPGTQSSIEPNHKELKIVKAKQDIDLSYLEVILQKEAHVDANLVNGQVIVQKASSIEDIKGKISLL